MIFELYNQITVRDPTPELIQWVKENLVLDNPDYIKKERMGFWVGNTPKRLFLFEKDGQVLRLPYGVLTMLPTEIKHQIHYEDKFIPQQPIYFGCSIQDFHLYDYQQAAVYEMFNAKEGILEAPAGSGKTQMFLALAVVTKRKTLILCHTLDLCKQAYDRACKYIDKSKLGLIKEGKVDIGECITFATVQTMSKQDLTRLKDTWDCVIVDECHRVSASASSLSMYQKVLTNLAARHKYGVTATVHRSDGMIKATFALIGKVSYEVPREAVADKIMKVGIKPIPTSIQMSEECLNSDGTLNYGNLITYLTTNEERNKLIATTLQEHSQHSSLVLSDRLNHLESIIALLPEEMKEQTAFVSGKMTTKKGKLEREQAIEDMRQGNKKYLFATYSLAKEGLDIPNLTRLYLTTPQKDSSVVIQSIGRVARTCKGKKEAIAYDFVDEEIGYCKNAFKKRKGIYKKIESYIE